MAGGLSRFGTRYRAEARKVMTDSRERVRDATAAITPVLTGRMRSLLRQQPTGQGLGYIVYWTGEDFREVGQPFYAQLVVLGYLRQTKAGVVHVPARDPLTPSLEAERPRLLEEQRAAAFRAARG